MIVKERYYSSNALPCLAKPRWAEPRLAMPCRAKPCLASPYPAPCHTTLRPNFITPGGTDNAIPQSFPDHAPMSRIGAQHMTTPAERSQVAQCVAPILSTENVVNVTDPEINSNTTPYAGVVVALPDSASGQAPDFNGLTPLWHA